MTRQEFQMFITDDFSNFDKNFFNQIEKYKHCLQLHNQITNLTRLDKEDKIYGDYFYESIIPYAKLDFKRINNTLDIGSGSGIPGVVLKLLYPHIHLTIIESNNKKCNFLKALMKELQIEIVILNIRAENIPKDLRNVFDLVTSRAVTNLPYIIELSLPYTKINGLVIEPRSSKLVDELDSTKPIITALAGELVEVNSFTSKNNHQHNVVIIKKIHITHPKYPRSWNEIIKGFK